jgi:uncharacterized membrane protein
MRPWRFLSLAGFGATAMYLLDPARGRRRRAGLRDTVVHTGHVVDDAVGVVGRDVRNRSRGRLARLRARLGRRPDDRELGERIRSGLGSAGGVGFPLRDTNWSPTARVMAGAGGSAIALLGMRRGGLTGRALGVGGLTLLVRGLTNLEMSRLLGMGGGRRGTTVHKTITVDAPIEEVFAFWDHYENFPRFMAHVREVRPADAGRSHWVVTGPAGVPVSWDTEVSAYVPNELMGWRTIPGSAVDHAGLVRFERAEGGTRIHVRMSYDPPAGALGHTVAALLGSDPGRAMDADLARFKSLMEEGKTTARGKAVRRDQLGT